MTITSLNGIGGTGVTSNVSTASDKLLSALNSIVSGTNQSADIADVSVATQLQSQISALKAVSGNLTQAFSLTQVASGGIGQIGEVISQLQSLASQAQSPALNASNRKQLGQQFQQLTKEFNNIATTTSFNGQDVLDGSLSGANALSLNNLLGQSDGSGDNTLSIADLSSNSLFGGQDLNIDSPDAAGQALSQLGDALNQVIGAQASVGAFQQTLNYATANVDSAITNQQAAQSSISDADLANASAQSSLADVQYNAAIAVAAQTDRLPPALLQLVG